MKYEIHNASGRLLLPPFSIEPSLPGSIVNQIVLLEPLDFDRVWVWDKENARKVFQGFEGKPIELTARGLGQFVLLDPDLLKGRYLLAAIVPLGEEGSLK